VDQAAALSMDVDHYVGSDERALSQGSFCML